ncbi:MAG TPA: sigma-70 family RNA polymerase sigma factor [Pyrinomonadaceae bacterium]|nr:sigma-70 family RNA polymerase sigma factor [Pyrinomonadaceae bacterium]
MQAQPSEITDNDLLRGITRGDEQALGAIYDRYRLILFGLILRILHDRQEAEDVLQETFLQVWRRAADFDESRGRVFTWLVTIARSRALDRLRALGSRARLADEVAHTADADAGDAAQDALKSEQGTIVRQALAELPAEQRRALFLAYFEGLTQTEISARLGEPLGTVKTRMRTGLMKLRALLAESRGL